MKLEKSWKEYWTLAGRTGRHTQVIGIENGVLTISLHLDKVTCQFRPYITNYPDLSHIRTIGYRDETIAAATMYALLTLIPKMETFVRISGWKQEKMGETLRTMSLMKSPLFTRQQLPYPLQPDPWEETPMELAK